MGLPRAGLTCPSRAQGDGWIGGAFHAAYPSLLFSLCAKRFRNFDTFGPITAWQ